MFRWTDLLKQHYLAMHRYLSFYVYRFFINREARHLKKNLQNSDTASSNIIVQISFWLNYSFIFFIKDVNASLRVRSVVHRHLRGATGIYLFWIYFFKRIYLFTENLLGLISVSVFQSTHTLTSPSHSALTLRRNYVGFISRCMRIY